MAEMTSEEPTLVTTMEHCKEIATILSKETILAVDCEGVYHGTRFKLTLLQIGTCKGDVYMFDVQENTDLLSNVQLKHLLESEEIEKVMFKCSKESSALDHDFKVTLRNVFDIQVAHIILEEQKGRKLFPTLKLRNVCQVYSSTDKVSKDEEEIMKICAVETSGFWRERPITEKMVSVAAGHVKALIPEVYREQKRRIESSGLNQKFKERVLESVKLYIDRTVYTQRKDRINGHVMEILQSLENACTPNTKLQDFEKDSEERKALQIVDFENVRNMSQIIQQLKKECIHSNLDEILKEVKSEEAKSLITSSKLRFTNKARHYPDESIKAKAKHVRDQIQKIVLSGIERKNVADREIRLSTCEEEILRDLPIWRDDDSKFSRLIKDWFWRLLENDLARKSKALNKFKKEYRLNRHFYDQMVKFARCSPTVPLPQHVREKVNTFLNDLRSYGIDT